MKKNNKIVLAVILILAVLCISLVCFLQPLSIEKTSARYVSLVTAEETIIMTVSSSATGAKTIALDRQGGTNGDTAVTVFNGFAVPTVEIPEWENHSFLGYYDAVTGGTMYFSAQGVPACEASAFSGVTTLYAHWN